MENATKALLIAGGVLVVIVLIALGIQMINSTRPATDQIQSTITAQEIQTYNNRFVKYAGIQKGNVLKAIVSEVRQNNITNKENIIKVIVGTDTVKYTDGWQIEPNTNGYYEKFFNNRYSEVEFNIAKEYNVKVMRSENYTTHEKSDYIRYIYISPILPKEVE